MNAPVSTDAVAQCPCCGSRLGDRAAEVLIETDSGMVRVGAQSVYLTPKEMEVLARLAEVSPRMLTRDALMDWLYQLDPDGGAHPKIIDVYVSKIRAKIRPLGLDIETLFWRGWRFRCERTVSILQPLRLAEVWA